MAFGLEFINDAGSLCISESYKNPVLVVSGNATTVAETVLLTASKFTVSYTRSSYDEIAMLAVRPAGAAMLVGITDPANLTWQWTFYSEEAVGVTVPYWIFSNKATITADAFGLEVFNASGSRVFSSAMKPLRIRNVVNWNVSSFGTTDYTYETGRTYAAILTQWSNDGQYFIMSNYTDMYAGGVTGIANGIRASGVYYSQVTGDDSNNPWNTMPMIIVDVTNY